MSEVVANIIVVFAIAVSAVYCAWRLGPQGLRERLRKPLSLLIPALARGGVSSSGCSACEGCPAARKSEPRARAGGIQQR